MRTSHLNSEIEDRFDKRTDNCSCVTSVSTILGEHNANGVRINNFRVPFTLSLSKGS
jgi:hypothetical protein